MNRILIVVFQLIPILTGVDNLEARLNLEGTDVAGRTTSPPTYMIPNDAGSRTLIDTVDCAWPVMSNCPADLTVTLNAANEANIYMTEPNWTSSCPKSQSETVEYLGGCTNPQGQTFQNFNSIDQGVTYLYEIRGAGTVVFTWGITDENDRSAECKATVTVLDCSNDTEPPVAKAKDVTVQLDANGAASFTAGEIDNGSTDNCEIASINVSATSFDCSNLDYGLTFNGANDVDCGNAFGNFGTGDFSIETWFKTSGTNMTLISKREVCDVGSYWNLSLDDNGELYLEINGAGFYSDIAVNTNQWTHVAFVREGLNIYVYINGEFISAWTTGDIYSISNPASVFLGKSPCNRFTGMLDEVRFWSVARQAADIKSWFDKKLTGSESGLAAYYDFEDGPGSATIQDKSTNHYEGTLSGFDVDAAFSSPGKVSPNEVMLTVTDAAGNSSTATATVTVLDTMAPIAKAKDITVYLDPNGVTTVAASDVDGGSADNCGVKSTTVSTMNFDCSNLDYGLTFDGINDRIDCGTDFGNFDTGDFTIETWFKTSETDLTLLSKRDVCNVGSFWTLSTKKTGEIYLEINGTQSLTSKNAVNTNQWTHVAAVREGLLLSLYINGELDSTMTTASVLSINNPISVFLGQSACTNYQGTLDEVRIWKVARQAADIKSWFDKKLSGNENGLEAYYDFEDGPESTAILDKSANHHDGTLIGFDNTFAFTSPGKVSFNSILLTVTDASGNSSSATASIAVVDTLAPVAKARDITVQLDTNGMASITAADVDAGSTDNCSVGTSDVSAVRFGCNNLDYGLTFDGSSEFVDCGNAFGDFGTGDFTIETWFKTSESNLTLLSKRDVCSAGSFWTLSTNTSGEVYIEINGIQSLTSKNPVNTNEWTHVAAVREGETISLYINGALDVTRTTSSVQSISNPASILLGQSPCNNYQGSLDEVRIWKVARQAADIKSWFGKKLVGNENGLEAYYDFDDAPGSTTILDKSTNHHDGTLSGFDIATAFTSPGKIANLGLGTHSIMLIVTDVVGNSSSAPVNVTVMDTIAPIAKAKDITVQLDANGTATIEATDVDDGSTDNCSISSVAVSATSFDCGDQDYTYFGIYVGPQTVTLTVTDAAGNSSTATATVTVVDTIAPVAKARDITLSLNSTGIAEVEEFDIDDGSTDNCEIVSRSVSPSYFDCILQGYGLTFDGVDDGVDCGNAFGNFETGDFTIETWFKTAESKSSTLLSKRDVCDVGSFWSLSMNGNGHVYIEINGTQSLFSKSAVNTNQWTHVAAVREGLTLSLYINGVLDDTLTTSSVLSISNPGSVLLGKSVCNQFAGELDEVRIWNVARQAADIKSWYDEKVVGDENGLEAYYDFEEGPGSVMVQDNSNNNNDGTLLGFDNATAFTTPGIAGYLGLGVHTVTLAVTDIAGNSSTATALVTIVDDTKPTIISECAADQSFTGSDSTLQISMQSPVFSDNCTITLSKLTITYLDGADDGNGMTSITTDFIQGETQMWPIRGAGQVVFEFTASDASGHSETCTSTVSSIVSAVDNEETNYKVYASPNPFVDRTTVEILSEVAQPLTLVVRDVTGKFIQQIRSERAYHHIIPIQNIDYRGVLFVSVEGDTFAKTIRLIKL